MRPHQDQSRHTEQAISCFVPLAQVSDSSTMRAPHGCHASTKRHVPTCCARYAVRKAIANNRQSLCTTLPICNMGFCFGNLVHSQLVRPCPESRAQLISTRPAAWERPCLVWRLLPAAWAHAATSLLHIMLQHHAHRLAGAVLNRKQKLLVFPLRLHFSTQL